MENVAADLKTKPKDCAQWFLWPGASTLEYLQRLSPICCGIFFNFPLLYWKANSYYPRGLINRNGNSTISRKEWEQGVLMPGAFKLDHLQPVESIWFWNFSYFCIFILGSQFLLPQRANNQKREFSQLQKRMTPRGLDACSIQTGPFAVHLAHFVL